MSLNSDEFRDKVATKCDIPTDTEDRDNDDPSDHLSLGVLGVGLFLLSIVILDDVTSILF